ncbi:MAG: phosphotransferase [Pseudomonadota bacterium]
MSDFTVTQIGQGVGIMGDIYRLELVYDDAPNERAPASVVVKLPSSYPENRAQGVALGMFEAEVRFYNELAPRAQVGMPRIYLAQIHSGTAEFVIVMEDLSAASMVDQQVGMSVAQARAAVEVLASIHATWWDDVQNPTMEWIPAMTGPRIQFVDETLPGLLPAFTAGFADYLSTDGLALFTAFTGNYLRINQVLASRSPWTLVHQDYRVENLLFGKAGGEVTVLDWQGIGRGPGAYDLAYILGGSMTTELRQAHEDSLVQNYHDALSAQGVQGYTLAQCREDYALAHLMGGIATPILLGGGMDLSNARGVELVATMASRHAQAALDHDGLARLREILG